MARITRVGVTFPPDLLRDFDTVILENGSLEALQSSSRRCESIREREEVASRGEGNVSGCADDLYDNEVRGLEEELTHVQHHYTNVISSSCIST